MRKMHTAACAIVLGGLVGLAANAEVLNYSYDTTLASPDVNTSPTSSGGTANDNLSWYNGSGNATVQGGWTVATGQTSGIEIGLRAKYRQGDVIDTPTNVYQVPYGLQPSTIRANWNYEFSIDLQPGGPVSGGLTLQNVTAALTITDLTTGATATGNPMTYWADNTYFGGLGIPLTSTGAHEADFKDTAHGGTKNSNQVAGLLTGDYGFQNSENPTFGDFPLTALYGASSGTQGEIFNPNAGDTYQFTLAVYQDAVDGTLNTAAQNTDARLLASNSINVEVVTPEPSTWALLAGASLALLIAHRRRKVA